MSLCCNCGQVDDLQQSVQQSRDIQGAPLNETGRQLPPTVTACVRCSTKAGVSIGNVDEARSLAKSTPCMVSESARSLDILAYQAPSPASIVRNIALGNALNNIQSRVNDILLELKVTTVAINQLAVEFKQLSAALSPATLVEGNQRYIPKCRLLTINCKRKDEH